MLHNRCVDILIGLNAGSEGKGKYMSILSDNKYTALVRTGGPNAAHQTEFTQNAAAELAKQTSRRSGRDGLIRTRFLMS